MRIEILIFGITALLIVNIYTEGKYLKLIMGYKKYWQMAGIAFGAIVFYYLVKKNPLSAFSMVSAANDYFKYLPVDVGGVSPLRSPVVWSLLGGSGLPVQTVQQNISPYEKKIMTSGSHEGSTNTKVKRSVSETKKKFVAARQGWKCGDCQEQLNAWFEVDHKMRLEYGGSNHVDNLVALCRDCHGKKTTIENL